MIEQFWTEQFVIVIIELAFPINPPEQEEVIEQFWTEQFVIVIFVDVELEYPINPPEEKEWG